MTKKLVEDVCKFLFESAAPIVGDYESELFGREIWCRFQDMKIDSPIEQLLYIAFHTLMRIHSYDECEPQETKKGEIYLYGMALDPQVKIGEYRVDFIAFDKPGFSRPEKEFVVECDSQQWHERTEEQRRYEKQRDRFLISKGYKTLHFTGTEIKENPYKVAAEIMSHLTGRTVNDLYNVNFLPELTTTR